MNIWSVCLKTAATGIYFHINCCDVVFWLYCVLRADIRRVQVQLLSSAKPAVCCCLYLQPRVEGLNWLCMYYVNEMILTLKLLTLYDKGSHRQFLDMVVSLPREEKRYHCKITTQYNFPRSSKKDRHKISTQVNLPNFIFC